LLATITLWAMLTYCFRCWRAVPYLHVSGPLHSGKTTLFDVLVELAFRPIQSASMSAPALFRTLDSQGGALLYDEAERLRSDAPDQAEMRAMLTAGYRKGGRATRMEPAGEDGKTWRSVSYDVFSPKALACIAGLPATLVSRCVNVAMFRSKPDSPKPKRRLDAHRKTFQGLRDDLHALALEYGQTFRALVKKVAVCPEEINGRPFELWGPILALASWVEDSGEPGLLKLVQNHAKQAAEALRPREFPTTTWPSCPPWPPS
jgi:hypothetical protein